VCLRSKSIQRCEEKNTADESANVNIKADWISTDQRPVSQGKLVMGKCASDEGCGVHPGVANGDESTWDERRNMDELRFDMGKLETQ
jgi:hypothetical protein